MLYLGITVAATITLYYELYIQGAVSTKIIQHYGFTFTQFVFVLVIGNAVGAFASLWAGLADRWGRANLVVGGLLLTGLLIEFALPNASSKADYTVFFALVSLVEGIALVATPALIRDFSPQVGRGAPATAAGACDACRSPSSHPPGSGPRQPPRIRLKNRGSSIASSDADQLRHEGGVGASVTPGRA
jgi:MFS family permease